MKPPRLLLDLDAVRYNARAWVKFLAPRELWAVVKSDGYGLGAASIARACLDGGARRLCVVDIEEARQLRAAGIEAPIVHVHATPPEDLDEALRLGVTISVDENVAAGLAPAVGLAPSVRAHVAIDTGTGWSGVPPGRIERFAAAVRDLNGIEWEGAWTHIAGPDSYAKQVATFQAAVAALQQAGIAVPVLHIASTAPALCHSYGQAARIGIGLYGSTLGSSPQTLERSGRSSDRPSQDFHLRTALEVRATVVAVKTFEAETPLGYSGMHVAKAGDRIATLRIGYADGWPRSLSGTGLALLGGRRCSIVGAVGMNFTMAEVKAEIPVAIGDEAVLLGEIGGLRLDDLATAAGLIPHALVTSLANGMR